MRIWALGDRIAKIRVFRELTQQELAVRAGVSKDVVSRLEQGAREGLRIGNLYKVVDALGARITIEIAADGDTMNEQDRAILLPARRLLLPAVQVPASFDEQDLTFASLRRRVRDCTADFNRARYIGLATDIPELVPMIEAAVGLHENEAKAAVYRLLAETYVLMAQTLILLRNEDLACEAVRRAMDAAVNAGDPILRASAARNYTWAFTRQNMFGDAQEIATSMAEEIGEPSITKSAPEHLAVWGLLLTEASRAAAFNSRADTAEELLSHAHSAAARMSAGPMDYDKYWAAFNPTRIFITRVEVALIGGDAGLALHLGKNIRRIDRLHLDVWAGHLLDLAYAQTAVRDYTGAIDRLESIRQIAPEYIKNHRVAYDVATRLLDASDARRAKSSGLAELAGFIGVKP